MGPTSITRRALPSPSLRRRWARAAAVATVLALALVGCGGDDDDGDDDAAPTTDETTASSAPDGGEATSEPAGETSEPSDTTVGGSETTAVERPPVGSCVDVPEATDGVYVVADAGTAVVRREGDRLAVGDVTPNEGWTSSVETDDDGDVDVDFERGQEEVWLEVEIVGGEVRAEICADD